MSDSPRSLRGIRSPRVAQEDVSAALALLLVALFFFRRAVFGDGVLFRRDISLVWYPQVESFVRCIHAGSWPLWDPYRGFGQPLLADPSAQILYPFTWMNLVAAPWTVFTMYVVSHLCFSGVGLYALARRLRVSRGGAFIAAIAWIASGPFLSLASLWHHMAGAAWMPWVLLAADVALETGEVRRILLWGATMAAQVLAGSADMVAMTLIVITIHAIAHRVEWTAPLWRSRRIATATLLAVVAGLALSAALWIPALAMARGTARLGLDPRERVVWSLHPLTMLETILPFHWDAWPLSPTAFANLLESREPWLHSIYLGVPLLALALAGISDQRRNAGFVLVAVGAALVALGRHLPFYDLAMWALPPLRILRFPVKAMVASSFAMAILAGFGFDRWRDEASRGSREWRFGVVVPLILLALMAGVATLLATVGASAWVPALLTSGPGIPSMPSLLAPVAWRFLLAFGAACAILYLSSRPTPAGSGHAIAIGLAMALDLGAAHRNLHPVAPKLLFTHRPEVLSALPQADDDRVYVYDYSILPKALRSRPGWTTLFRPGPVPHGWSPLQFLTLAALDYLTPPTGARWGIYGSYDMDLLGLQPRPLVELNEFLRQQEGTPIHTRLLRMGAVSRVVDLAPPSRWPDLPLEVQIPGLFEQPIRVYRVPEPLPRAFIVGKALTADGHAALDTIATPDFDPARTVVLPEKPAQADHDGRAGEARVLELKPDRVVVSADLAVPGYLVLVDAYDAGWQVSVDGQAVPLRRANVAFRAVEVPAGSHEIVFRYRPSGVLLGIAISAVTLAVVLGCFAFMPGSRS